MEEMRIIYKILKTLKESLDYEEFDTERISPEALGITKTKRDNLLAMLQKNGLVEGLTVREYIDNAADAIIINSKKLKITLKGIQYLEENSMMKKAANAAKGILGALS